MFLRGLLSELNKKCKIVLFSPVDIIPSFSDMSNASGFKNKTNEIIDHFKRTIFTRLKELKNPVRVNSIRYIAPPPKKIFIIIGIIQVFIKTLIKIQNISKSIYLFHGHTIVPDGVVTVLLGKYFNFPKVITVHGSDVNAIKKNSILFKLSLFAINNADKVTCVSCDLKNELIKKFKITGNNISVINNGVSPTFHRIKHSNEIRQKYKILHDAPLYLFVGSLLPVKDPTTLLVAFKRVLKTVKDANLIIVGDGYLKNEMEIYISIEGLKSNVHFSGHINHRDVAKYMLESDFLCISSIKEGWPTIIFEALSCGLPVISTDVGGISEALVSSDYGIIVPPGNPERFANAMINSLNKRWDHNKIRNYAHNNSWGKVAKKYLNVYEKVLSNNNTMPV